jgi:hypothetical protein
MAVLSPVAGAGFAGLLFASGGLLAWWHWKRRHRALPVVMNTVPAFTALQRGYSIHNMLVGVSSSHRPCDPRLRSGGAATAFSDGSAGCPS